MEFLEALWDYLLLSAPYLIFGLILSGVIDYFLTQKRLQVLVGGSGVSSVIKASLFGVPLPLCSCSVIPTAVTLRQKGASKAATSSFLISTPESGVDSISLTYALLDLPMTIIRPIAAFCSAFVAGTLQLIFNSSSDDEVIEQKKSCCSTKKNQEKDNLLLHTFRFAFGKLLNDIALWLTIGIILGALIGYIVPDNFFENLSATESRLMILLVGIPLYICATASTPIALSLILKGMSPGVALLLLLVGPATNISNIAVLQKYIGKRGVVINILSIAIIGLIFSYITDYLYDVYFASNFSTKMSHEHENSILEFVSAILLVPMLCKGIWAEHFSKKGHSH